MLTPPRIDQRDQQLVAEQVRELLLKYCGREWADQKSIMEDGNADAVIQVFSRMMEIIIQRLNKVPDKNFLTFLDLVGTRLSPPRVARAPLTFTMAEGAKKYGFIPAGTQVATIQTKEHPALVFETESGINIIQSTLARAVSLSPGEDKWTNHSDVLFDGKKEKEVELLRGKEQVPHRLYLGHSKLLNFEQKKTITLYITIDDFNTESLPEIPKEWEVKWYYFDETLSPKPLNVLKGTDIKVANLLSSDTCALTFEPVSGISEKLLTGFEKGTGQKKTWKSHWIFAELKTPVPRDKLPEITSITATIADGTGGSAVPPDLAFFNSIPLDFTKDFYPFGEHPKFNDTFYIGSKEIFSKEGAIITIEITLSPGANQPPPDTQVTLCWEFWDGKSWEKIAVTDQSGAGPNASGGTTTFTKSGNVTFTCPKIEAKEVNGKENFWVRVRIINGNYGSDATYETTNAGIEGTGKISSDDTKVTGGKIPATIFSKEIRIGDSITAKGQTKKVKSIKDDTFLTVEEAFDPPLPAGTEFTLTYGDTSSLKGTGTISSNGTEVTGDPQTKTIFTREIRIGDSIIADKQTRIVTYIEDDDSLTVNMPFKPALTSETAFMIQSGWIYKPPTYMPPSISKLTLNFSFSNKEELQYILAFNDFIYQDQNYLFSWNEIPGNDNWRLIDFLGSEFGINWIKQAKIEKIEASNTIRVFTKTNSILLNLNLEKTKVNIKIDDTVSTNELIARTENGNLNIYKRTGVYPFQPVKDTEPAFYLAFDQDISTLPVTLFFPLLENKFAVTVPLAFDGTDSAGPGLNATEVALKEVFNLHIEDVVEFRNRAGETEKKTITDIVNNIIKWKDGLTKDFSTAGSTITLSLEDTPPVLAWEYWNGKIWSLLSVNDETENLTKRGLIQFSAPEDMKNRYCFEEEYYWIRARLDKGRYETMPRLKSIHTNSVWASNLITVKEEILGSSNGKTNQLFNSSHFPVHFQKVLVQELSLTTEERQNIISEEKSKDAVEEIKDAAGYITGYWVRWHEVNHFFSSGPHSRHYIIDKNKGTITFGDGERGMIPPAGKNNIKCTYMYGGGKNGNYAGVNSITKLRMAFDFVESVTNHEAADGGGDKEELDRARERGPQTIKHRERAVTFEDYEWLVRASPKIARVKCLQTTHPSKKFKPGWITIIIVPDERENPKPIPTQGLIDEIKRDLFSKASSYLTESSQIALIGPGYIQVRVEAQVHFTSIAEAKVIEGKIIDDLNRFFHPLTGGPDEEGWNFGKDVHISEVYKVIEGIEGVDYVEELTLRASIQIYKLNLGASFIPEDSYPENSKVIRSDGKIVCFLAEKIEEEKETTALIVKGFKEGDLVTISNTEGDYITTVVLKSVSDELLECETNTPNVSIPAESIVETSDGIKSYVVENSKLKPDQDKVILLKVAIFGAVDQIRKITNINDTALEVDAAFDTDLPAGTEFVIYNLKGTGTISSSGVNVTGSGTKFTEELKIGDSIIASDQIRQIIEITGDTNLKVSDAFSPDLPAGTEFIIYTKKGTGTISSNAVNITGNKTKFTKELKAGISIEAEGQIRKIIEIASDTVLKVDAAFDTDLPAGTEFVIYNLKGTGTISSSGVNVTGSGTKFTKELGIGDSIGTVCQIDLISKDKPDKAIRLSLNPDKPPSDRIETVYIEDNYLVYSGVHSINK